MKILLINWQDPANPRAGGAEIHLFETFRRLVGAGHEITWLASGWDGADQRESAAGIEIQRAGSRYTFGAASVLHYRRHLASIPFDVVVEALNKVPLYAPIWSRQPVVLLVHHLFGRTAFREAPLPLATMTWLQERPIASVYRRTPVQAISHSTKADLVQRGLPDDHIEVIHPGIDHDYFFPDSSPSRSIAPTFLYLGRLQRYKRIDLILSAFAAALPELPGARLIVAGRGDQEGPLRAQARDLGVQADVQFAGFVSEERKRELLRSCWANVFTSPKEGWGITNLEAAACGTPTIASDSPGLRESVVDGRTGIPVPHGDALALAAAMRQLGRDWSFTETLGKGAFDFARCFTWDRTAAATERHLVATLPPNRQTVT